MQQICNTPATGKTAAQAASLPDLRGQVRCDPGEPGRDSVVKGPDKARIRTPAGTPTGLTPDRFSI